MESHRSWACRRCTTPTTTGTRSSRPVPRPAPSSTCTSDRRRRCPPPPPTPPGGGVDADAYQRHVLVGGLLVLGGTRPLPDPYVGALRGPDRVDPLHPQARRQGVGGEPQAGPGRRQGARATLHLLPPPGLRLLFDDAHQPPRSVDEIGADNITYQSDYPHSDSTWPHTKEIAERQMAHLDDDHAARSSGATPSGSSGSTAWRPQPAGPTSER